MKKIITSLLLMISISITTEAQQQLTSRTDLMIELMAKVSQSDQVKSVQVGNDSKAFPILLDDQEYFAIAVGPQDASAGQMSVEDFGSIQVKLNAMVLNKTMVRHANSEENLSILNWETVKGFRWDSQRKVNRLPESYPITTTNQYGLSLKEDATINQALVSVLKNQLGVSDFLIFGESRESQEGISYARAYSNGSVFLLVDGGPNGCTVKIYDGGLVGNYNQTFISAGQVRLIALTIPRMTVTGGIVESYIEDSSVVLKHIGEKIE